MVVQVLIMSTADRLDALRERNKDLLNLLRKQREKLERVSGCSQSRKREREAEAEERARPAEMVTVTGGDRGPARAALARPTVRFADACERQMGILQTISMPSLTIKYNGENAQYTDGSDRCPRVQDRLQDTREPSTKSCLVNYSKKQDVHSRVTFQSDESEQTPASDRHHLQPLLGYDWIAGVLDAEDSLIERSDEFFNDLRMFRSLNKDECVHSPQAEFSEENHSGLELPTDKNDPETNTDTHQCTFSYRINSRLFPVPLHSQECCPVCNKHKSSHPHTAAEPALIRVSIPRSTLLPPYKHKAHRRCSFDPSDSLGLPSHCLSGWMNTGQSILKPPRGLDLQSSLNMKSSTESHNKQLGALSVPRVSSNHFSNHISGVSRLARHNFQHFSPKRKVGSTCYPVC
ncbi:migration and invasion inhibitory protein isoform X2 [Mastacembelus armatus]|uniref:migration and invasion inhibitory protein isoform X2 n=1 Tax=Mastacembelus armatus TaxID=205130 RepID=UPI000E4615E3|nr:migration and invasion-inhibitory protein isoform X2 [Mastacembelus armatus]